MRMIVEPPLAVKFGRGSQQLINSVKLTHLQLASECALVMMMLVMIEAPSHGSRAFRLF